MALEGHRWACRVLLNSNTFGPWGLLQTSAAERFQVVRPFDRVSHQHLTLDPGQRDVGLRAAQLLQGRPGEVVVACHGGVINAYVGEVIGLDTAMFFRPAHASVHRVRAHELTRALWSLNETHHLVGEGIDLVSY